MPDYSCDTTASRVLQEILNVLRTLSTTDDTPVFQAVGVYDDLESFRAKFDGLAGVTAGICPDGPPERIRGMDSSEPWCERLSLKLAVCIPDLYAAGGDEKNATSRMIDTARTVRSALLADRTRGGLANLIQFAGEPLNGTEVFGSPRLENRRANQAFNLFTIPVQVGWSVNDED